jgi:hypothetical protein
LSWTAARFASTTTGRTATMKRDAFKAFLARNKRPKQAQLKLVVSNPPKLTERCADAAAEPPNSRSLGDENLDVPGLDHEHDSGGAKGAEGELAFETHLSVVCPFPAQPGRQQKHRGRYRPRGGKYRSVPQAANLVEAVRFAKIGLPLVAHLTIHWSGTDAFDDHDGTRFAKVREGL